MPRLMSVQLYSKVTAADSPSVAPTKVRREYKKRLDKAL